MKRFISLAVVAFLALASYADNVSYLTLRTLDGTEQSLTLADGIKITFDGGQFVAKAGESIFQTPLSNMQDMWFSFQLAGIGALAQDDFADGQTVSVYTADGRLVRQNVQLSGNSLSLPAGIYVFKSGDRIVKRFIK